MGSQPLFFASSEALSALSHSVLSPRGSVLFSGLSTQDSALSTSSSGWRVNVKLLNLTPISQVKRSALRSAQDSPLFYVFWTQDP
jgi:hypothetical protein